VSTKAQPGTARKTGMAALALGALGVVFGDIGTSPLYALQAVFAANDYALKPDEAGVYGVISLVFWAITIIVSVKYLTFIMRADNHGEGGIMALIALIQGVALKGRVAKAALVALGIFGAALFYGDGMITPAISVLSAVEGLQVAAPGLDSLVLPITLAVLTALFAIQRFGTRAVGRLFGPVMVVWFSVLAVAGLVEVAQNPEILRALSPTYGVAFFLDGAAAAFLALGSIVLAVTGAEALYADMGHFGRPPIHRAWFFLVFPALTLNYLGQGALILDSPRAIDNPFFRLFPDWGRVPMVLLATIAAVNRFTSRDLWCLLGHPPSGAAGAAPAAPDPAHVPGRGADIRPGDQCAPLHRGGRARARLRLLTATGLGLRHRRDRDLGHRHPPLLRGGARSVEQAAVARAVGRDGVFDRGPGVFRGEPSQGRGGRLVSAAACPRGLRAAHNLAPWTRAGHRAPHRGRGRAT
jgi:hypothetical protein